MLRSGFVMTTNAHRLRHFLKVAAGNAATRVLEAMSRRGRGPGQRVSQADNLRLNDLSYRHVTPSVPLAQVAPRYFADGPAERKYLDMFADMGDGLTTRGGIITVRNVDVTLPFGMHRWKGRVFEEALLGVELLTNPKYAIDLESIPFRRKNPHGEAVLLTMPWHHNFYHWMIEILPRVMLIDQVKELQHLKLIVPDSAPGFIRESLAWAGCAHRVEFLNQGVHRFDRLHIPSRLSRTADVSPLAIDWLNRRLPSAPVTGRRRLYITRSDARNRFVNNEDEVMATLGDHGFEKVTLSGLPLQQQIDLFREAEFIVGSHGAGFAHLAFAQPGTRFIEFFEQGHFNRCFYQIAGVRKLNYGFLVGQPRGFGFDVDAKQLRDVMELAR